MLLLDTHVAVWLARGIELSQAVRDQIMAARAMEGVYISSVTVWEVGNLLRKGKAGLDISLSAWVERFRAEDGFNEAPLTADIVVEAANLPGRFHNDPADRFLVATARHLNIPMMTRDKRILDYARVGHVRAVKC